MNWLEAIVISALIIFLASVIVVGIMFLLVWATERNKDLEMFVVIVIAIMWIMFTITLRVMGWEVL
jgi:hypothetical protein